MSSKRARWSLALLLLLAVSLAVVGPRRLARRASRQAERSWLILTGRLIDVGGYRLRVESSGGGIPTVVLDAGLSQGMQSWGKVPAEVARLTRVVAYDRAGLGKSDSPKSTGLRTSEQIVDDLHTMLANAKIAGPYVFVGHSFGGLNIRLYASRYPNEVAGLVLVDASHEDQYEQYAALKGPEERERYLRHEGGANSERVDLLASAAQLRGASPLPCVPMVVLTANPDQMPSDGSGQRVLDAHKELQRKLAQLLPDSKHVIAEKSGHFIQLDQPELVVAAIRAVVEASRRNTTQVGDIVAGIELKP